MSASLAPALPRPTMMNCVDPATGERLGEVPVMDRAAVGLGSIFIYLRVRMNWYKLFHELIDGFQGSQLAQRQQQALCVVGINP